MIVHTRTSYLPNGIIVRTYSADKFSEAAMFAGKWHGQLKPIFNGFKNVWRILV